MFSQHGLEQVLERLIHENNESFIHYLQNSSKSIVIYYRLNEIYNENIFLILLLCIICYAYYILLSLTLFILPLPRMTQDVQSILISKEKTSF